MPAALPPPELTLPAAKPGHVRPLVAIVADAGGAETTDFIIPYGVLKDAGAADVVSLSTADGPLQLKATVKIRPDATTAAFDNAHPEGADIVVVPAQMKPESPTLIAWVKAEAGKGAVVVSICEGARVLAAAGLLDGKRATTHFAAMRSLERAYPRTTWVRDRRYVQDGRIVTTTGVTASMPASLALVEAIAGRPAAEAEAARLGVSDWTPKHRTADFHIDISDYVRGAAAYLAAPHETVETRTQDGADEIALALEADAWSRTLRSRVRVTTPGSQPVVSRHGLIILPDAEPAEGALVLDPAPEPPARALDTTLSEIGRRYGPEAIRLAKLGMEYDERR